MPYDEYIRDKARKMEKIKSELLTDPRDRIIDKIIFKLFLQRCRPYQYL